MGPEYNLPKYAGPLVSGNSWFWAGAQTFLGDSYSLPLQEQNAYQQKRSPGRKTPFHTSTWQQLLIPEVGVCGASLVLQAKFLLLARQEAVSKDGLKEDQLI